MHNNQKTGAEKCGVRDYFLPCISQKALIKLRHCESGQINFFRDKNTKFVIQPQIVNIINKYRSNTEQQQTEQVIFKNIYCIYIYKNSYNIN